MKIIFCALLSASILLNSCTKQGPAGPAGNPGANGVSNISSSVITTSAGDWKYNSSLNYWLATYTNPAITQSVIDNGTIEMFYNSIGSSWVAMPCTTPNYSYGYVISPGSVTISCYNTSVNPGTLNFKAVIIPG